MKYVLRFVAIVALCVLSVSLFVHFTHLTEMYDVYCTMKPKIALLSAVSVVVPQQQPAPSERSIVHVHDVRPSEVSREEFAAQEKRITTLCASLERFQASITSFDERANRIEQHVASALDHARLALHQSEDAAMRLGVTTEKIVLQEAEFCGTKRAIADLTIQLSYDDFMAERLIIQCAVDELRHLKNLGRDRREYLDFIRISTLTVEARIVRYNFMATAMNKRVLMLEQGKDVHFQPTKLQRVRLLGHDGEELQD